MLTSYIAGAVAGAAYGSLVGFLKYTLLWKKIIKSDDELTTGMLYKRMGISYAVNIATLFVVFIVRDLIPCNFAMALVFTALALSLMGKLAPMASIVDKVKPDQGK